MAKALSDASFPASFVAGAIPHPSITLEEMIWQKDAKQLVSTITTPILLLPAGNDPDRYRQGGDIYETLKANNSSSEVDDSFKTLTHGWSIRGDISDAVVYDGVSKAFEKIESYFSRF